MSYQPSEAVKRVQKLMESVEQRTQEYERLKAGCASAEIEVGSKVKALDAEREKAVKAASDVHDNAVYAALVVYEAEAKRISQDFEAKRAAVSAEYNAKMGARDRALVSMEQGRTQLQRELEKLGLIVEPARETA